MQTQRHGKLRKASDWVQKTENELAHEDEILVRTAIILRLSQYMRDHNLRQKDLANLLGVSPQYVNKLLHDQDFDLKISTAVRYGRLLGTPIIIVPGMEDAPVYTELQLAH